MIKELSGKAVWQRFTAVLTAITLIVGLAVVPCGNSADAALKLSRNTLKIKVGKSVKLKVKGKFAGKVKWSSTKKKIATVNSKGIVKGVKKGKATIIAKAGGKKMNCKVTVTAQTADDKTANQSVLPGTQTVIPGGDQQGVQPQQQITPEPQPVITPEPEPTAEPEPTPTPKYMQEGAFVYEALDISWIDPEKPMVAFTFDDGPVGNRNTDSSMRILNTLKEYGMHATFNYITGIINSEVKRAEILRALEDGNEIGNHTTGYSSLSSYSAAKIAEDVETARAALEEITGISSFTLRPPNLALNNDVYHNVPVPMIGCNVYSMDWEGKSTQEIINNVKNARDGDIVLMHETYTTTAEAVEYLVPYFADKGFQIVSVSELYAVKDMPLFPENYYNSTTSEPDRPKN